MPAQNATVLKSYFETNDQPTQQQFGDLVDSLQEARDNALAALTTANNANVIATSALASAASKVAKAGDTMTGALIINGSADTRQLIVREHSTQTDNVVLELRANDATAFFATGSAGGTVLTGYADVRQLNVLAATGQSVPVFQVSTLANASMFRVNATSGVEVTGRADAIQHRVAAHSAQTAVITQVANSAGSTIHQLYNTGHQFNSGRIMLGGETASFPAIKNNGARLQVRTANDTGLAGLDAADTFIDGIADVVQLRVDAVAGQTDLIFVVNDENDNFNFVIDNTGRIATFVTGSLNVGMTIDVETNSAPCEFRVNGIVAFQVNQDRKTWSPQGIYFGDGAEVFLAATAASCAKLSNFAENDWDRLQFGGATSSFPALKRVTTALHVKLADDSAFTTLVALDLTVQAGNSFIFSTRSKLQSPADGNILLVNNAVTDFGLLQFGGTTASFPALKRSTTILQVRLANDSNYAALEALNVTVDSSNFFGFTSRARIHSPADSRILLTDNAGTDFGRLQFGGTTASFPALKRSGADLQARLADDSDYANFFCKNLTLSGTFTVDTLTVTGGVYLSPTVVNTTYTVQADDRIVIGDHATVAFTITLPPVAGASGQYVSIKNRNNAVVTVEGDGAEEILTTSFVTSVNLNLGESLDLYSDGTQWLVL